MSEWSYRYTLSRPFLVGEGVCLFVMLNPSTADAVVNDPTVTRCMGFAKAWGFRELRVCNLFAVRSTDPKGLRECDDPVGPENDDTLRAECARADMVVGAWGVHGKLNGRAASVLAMLTDVDWHCLGQTKDGHPKHPLYVAATTQPVSLRPEPA